MYDESKLFGFPVVLDGYFLPKYLPQIFTARAQAQVTLLVGWNSAEIPAGAFMQGKPNTSDNFTARVKAEYPDTHQEVLRLSPHGNEKEVELSAPPPASDRFIAYAT